MVVGEHTTLVFKLVKALFLGAESTVLYGKGTSYDSEVMTHKSYFDDHLSSSSLFSFFEFAWNRYPNT